MESKNNSSLMYSEYMGNHSLPGCLKTEKPSMVFQKSQVLQRISNLLPQLMEAENNLDLSQDNNIESIDENESYVEMNVAIVNTPDDGEDVYSDEQESEDESEASDSETFSSIKSDIEAQLGPSVKICSKKDQKSKIEVLDSDEDICVQEKDANCVEMEDPSSLGNAADIQDKESL